MVITNQHVYLKQEVERTIPSWLTKVPPANDAVFDAPGAA